MLPEIVAVVAGRKSECLTSGLEQPAEKPVKLKSKMVVKCFMRAVCLTKKLIPAGLMTSANPRLLAKLKAPTRVAPAVRQHHRQRLKNNSATPFVSPTNTMMSPPG